MSQVILNELKKLFSPIGLFVLSTIGENGPRSRYMAAPMREDLSIWGSAAASSRKIHEMKQNPNVCCVTCIDPKNWGAAHAVITGIVQLFYDLETKKSNWRPDLKKHLKGPEDPEYVVYKITPKRIEYYRQNTPHPEVIELE
ncbi:MAG: pyridoxamine 5'-phosphate oxidase family protein [Candidatus Wallbacteria bacterium]|nr:pyridoxamine 5'-phosphate oxidase family protein [Candidatus Wallbacteria bacterium]